MWCELTGPMTPEQLVASRRRMDRERVVKASGEDVRQGLERLEVWCHRKGGPGSGPRAGEGSAAASAVDHAASTGKANIADLSKSDQGDLLHGLRLMTTPSKGEWED